MFIVLSGSPEVLLGKIPVSSRLALGSERLRLVFTNSRIIVDHAGKRGAGAVTGTTILGGLGGVLEDVFKSGRESLGKRGMEKMAPDRILRAHKDNFAIGYGEVVSVTLGQTPMMMVTITILTGDDKFEFFTRTRLEGVVRLFQSNLGNKLAVHRLPNVDRNIGPSTPKG